MRLSETELEIIANIKGMENWIEFVNNFEKETVEFKKILLINKIINELLQLSCFRKLETNKESNYIIKHLFFEIPEIVIKTHTYTNERNVETMSGKNRLFTKNIFRVNIYFNKKVNGVKFEKEIIELCYESIIADRDEATDELKYYNSTYIDNIDFTFINQPYWIGAIQFESNELYIYEFNGKYYKYISDYILEILSESGYNNFKITDDFDSSEGAMRGRVSYFN